ncbi:MAG: 50S ribosomal protein L17 [Ignavibacteriae bacterium]|nr:MAG: 50S ribosomal protein L17 [Ignavibacteriota bacterium]
MRHQNSGRKLKRTSSHRKATLAALCTALIVHRRIKTTLAKAKETRMFVEKIITRAKNAVAAETAPDKLNISARREVFSTLRSKDAVSALFKEIAPKVATRPGGYTRVVKLGRRLGDGAELAILELVDFNVGQEKAAAKAAKKSAPRTKGASKTKKNADAAASSEPSEKKAKKSPENSAGSPPTVEE